MLAYLVAIFASALLLFLVQPMIAKVILPWFGGSASVWTTCLLFFQSVLLLGYLYAHALVRRVRAERQWRIHLVVLAGSLVALLSLHGLTRPGAPWTSPHAADPALRILLILAATVGLPYFVLSSTSPLLQAWWTRERPVAPGSPYRLFALSNAGSLLALVAYPTIVEPLFSLRHQVAGWSAAFGAAAFATGFVAWRSRQVARSAEPEVGLLDSPSRAKPALSPPKVGNPAAAPRWTMKVLWVALAACASTLLLSITTHLSQNVAAIPFLWVLPLSLYLLSFILCFEHQRWYRPGLFLRLLAVALGGMVYALHFEFSNMRISALIPLFSIGLFICCMVCHGELARLKPDAAHLTSFYLSVALGGALGGVFVGLVAPRVFPDFWELPIGLVLCALLVLVVLWRDPAGYFYHALWNPAWLLLVALVVALAASAAGSAWDEWQDPTLMARNFYGVLRVFDLGDPDASPRGDPDDWPHRKLMNGTIDHGMQFLWPDKRRLPTTYYAPHSGAALALLEAERRGPVRAGLIGLGTGTLAAYGQPGDHYSFYEINPLVIQLANSQFTFLRDSRAEVTVVPGDARLSLAAEPPQGFDVLAVDAFTGDSIPIHLLTREAFELYFRHLKPGGVLAVHISNRYVDLKPVVLAAANSLGKLAGVVKSAKDDDPGASASTWVLVTGRRNFLDEPELRTAAQPLDVRPRLWTDDYSDLVALLKWRR